MKKLIILVFVTALVASCVVRKPLYNWDKYDKASYAYLKNSDDKSTQVLIETYEKIINKQNKTRMVVPPGIYADYGFILTSQGKIAEGKAMLEKEVELYPESKLFIDNLLKRLER